MARDSHNPNFFVSFLGGGEGFQRENNVVATQKIGPVPGIDSINGNNSDISIRSCTEIACTVGSAYSLHW